MFRSFSDKKSPRKSFRLKPPFTRHAISILICVACMLCATLASFLYQHIVPDNHANVALFYILALVIIARWTVGYGYGIVCTLFSVIAINYLFTYPYYKLNFTLTGYPITFLLMSGITLILCTMTSHMTIQSEMIAEREKRLAEAEMEKMRANLLRAISHDLRTPLTLIKGYAETVRDLTGSDDAKRTEQCSIIVDETNRLSTLVNSVMELSKVQSGAERPNLVDFDMSDLCFEVAGRYDALCDKNHWQLDLQANEPCPVSADPAMMERVMHNLLGNAFHHIGADGVVVLRAIPQEKGCRIEIEDHGPGIPPEDLPYIFDRYYRARQDSGRTGTGLGLSITKAILQQHGFAFGVDSAVGRGSTFWFEMKDTRK